MKKIYIDVPTGIRYLSQWETFKDSIPHNEHIILNKAHTGIGATYYYLSNDQKIIHVVPRVSLLENKKDKHPNVWIYRISSDNVAYDGKEDKPTYQNIQDFNMDVVRYVRKCYSEGTAPKIMTTYDSLGHVIDALNSMDPTELDSWTLVIDEFQSIFADSAFKSLTEMKLLANTARFKSVIYLSATPYLDKYLEQITEFRNLTYITLKWPSEMVEKAIVKTVSLKKLNRNEQCRKIIKLMQEGKTVKFGNKEIDTTEAVFYVNNVADIIRIITKAKLSQGECNILCSRLKDNETRLKNIGFTIGTIPGEGEPHKPFTFCTRSYFLGCDFYSEKAYSYVFADVTNSTLALDISTDLCQILGRQRLDKNPYRNEAILFIRENSIGLDEQAFKDYIKSKEEKTNNMIDVFNSLDDISKKSMIDMYRNNIEKEHYAKDYCYIEDDKNMKVGFNTLYMLAEMRAWEICKSNYSSLYRVIKEQKNAGIVACPGTNSQNKDVLAFKIQFEATPRTDQRIKIYSEFRKSHPDLVQELDFISQKYSNYWDALGYEGLNKLGFQESKIKAYMAKPTPFDDKVIVELRNLLQDKKYTSSEIKKILDKAYKMAGINKAAKATDINKYVTAKFKSDKKKGRVIEIESIYQKNITFFPYAWLPNSPKSMTIDRFLYIVKTGKYNIKKNNNSKDLSSIISEIRNLTEDKEIQKMKSDWLPVACFSGVFDYKDNHGLKQYSSFIALDYDHFENEEEIDKAKEYLQAFPFVYAIFKTPSGKGLKALVWHNSANPKDHYNLFYQLTQKCSHSRIDNSVVDISRGHFFSYDPDLWKNPAPSFYNYKYDPTIEEPEQKKERTVKGESGDIQLDSWVSDFLHNLWNQILTDEAIIDRLDKYWHKNYPEYYQQGHRHNGILAMSGSLCRACIPKDKTLDYLKKSYPDPDMTDEEIEKTVNYTYEHNPYGCDRGRW